MSARQGKAEMKRVHRRDGEYIGGTVNVTCLENRSTGQTEFGQVQERAREHFSPRIRISDLSGRSTRGGTRRKDRDELCGSRWCRTWGEML